VEQQFEPFVPVEAVAKFLSLSRRRVLELARIKGGIPSHPIGGTRKTYRFLLSEVHAWLKRRNG
jgi:excisionase family DNA binding protein